MFSRLRQIDIVRKKRSATPIGSPVLSQEQRNLRNEAVKQANLIWNQQNFESTIPYRNITKRIIRPSKSISWTKNIAIEKVFSIEDPPNLKFAAKNIKEDIYNNDNVQIKTRIKWKKPYSLIIDPEMRVDNRGELSNEKKIQTSRIQRIFEVVYPKKFLIPNSPYEPNNESHTTDTSDITIYPSEGPIKKSLKHQPNQLKLNSKNDQESPSNDNDNDKIKSIINSNTPDTSTSTSLLSELMSDPSILNSLLTSVSKSNNPTPVTTLPITGNLPGDFIPGVQVPGQVVTQYHQPMIQTQTPFYPQPHIIQQKRSHTIMMEQKQNTQPTVLNPQTSNNIGFMDEDLGFVTINTGGKQPTFKVPPPDTIQKYPPVPVHNLPDSTGNFPHDPNETKFFTRPCEFWGSSLGCRKQAACTFIHDPQLAHNDAIFLQNKDKKKK